MAEDKPRLVVGLDMVVAPASSESNYCSTNNNDTDDASVSLHAARQDGFDYVTTTIPVVQVGDNSDDVRVVRSDVTSLESKWWRTSVVGKIFIPSSSSGSSSTSSSSSASFDFQQPLDWSLHMNLPAVLIPKVPKMAATTTTSVAQYAASLAPCLSTLRDQQIWIPLTLQDAPEFHLFHRLVDYHASISIVLELEPIPTLASAKGGGGGGELQLEYTADMMRRLHLLIGAVPIAAIVLPTNIFLTNKRGFPTLSKVHQVLLSSLLRRVGRTTKVLLRSTINPSTTPTTNDSKNSLLPKLTAEQLGATKNLPYLQYLQHLRSSREDITSKLDSSYCVQEADYLDALQKPLQPLADHLEFQTYEVFEQDPVKYARYQAAVLLAMQAHVVTNPGGGSSSSSSSNENDGATAMDTGVPGHGDSNTYIVMVVGAGRGPLVTACIEAAKLVPALNFHVFAVEKNPSAVLYLKSKKLRDWKNLPVTVVHSDLRNLSAQSLFGSSEALGTRTTTTANLVVSELLGSFGCNELSPECLDGLYDTDVCGPNTISVPARYTSHAAPVSSMKLFHNVRQQALYPDPEIGPTNVVGLTKAMETPYVVRAHAASQTHVELDCWSFDHAPSCSTTLTAGHQPTTTTCKSRDRYVHLVFDDEDPTYAAASASGYEVADDNVRNLCSAAPPNYHLPWTCTGILGTFTAELYGNEQISTAPCSFSVGMFSWFPLYFPITTPLHVPPGALVHADIWRKCDDSKVWYEWSVQVVRNEEVLSASSIHNPGGRSYFVSK